MKKILIALFLCSFSVIYAQDFPEVKQIAERRTPWLSNSLEFKKIKTTSSEDLFEIEKVGDKVRISATTPSAASMGLGWYLKYYCHRSLSHLGDNLSKPDSIAPLNQKVTVSSPYKYRYALNYCTVSYSMANYKWADWERELDWMALSGVNLLLAPVGMEAVWQNTLMKIGYSREESLGFIAHPVFSAWWLMGNLEDWGGPVSQTVINQQMELQKKIVKRMKQLGINPVMQGFYGIVPTSLKEKMNVKVVPQGRWAGGFLRPDFLRPDDPAFEKISKIYYNEIKKLYGKDFKFFGGDPFHEGGSSGGMDVSQAASAIQSKMMKAFPRSTWVLQGWQSNPSKKLLSGLDREHTLVIELFGESTNNWEVREGYDRTPFVWCNVTNFGEKNGLYGKLERFANESYRTRHSEYGKYMCGVGIIPEGIYNNPVVYDLMLELGWHSDKVDVSKWLKGYIKYRYGHSEPEIEKAWEIFLNTVYTSPEVKQEGPSESIFCARPATSIKSVSTWGTRKRNYDPETFKEGVKLFVSLSDKYEDSETYQADKSDFLRQVLANQGDVVYRRMMEAIADKDIQEFRYQSSKFLSMIKMQDSLLSRSPFFRLDTWLAKAEAFGQNAEDKAQAVRNNKRQFSIWGPDFNPKTDLHEYAHKEWSGMLGTLYYDRWNAFCQNELAKLQGQQGEEVNYFDMDLKWIEIPLKPTVTISDLEYAGIVNKILGINTHKVEIACLDGEKWWGGLTGAGSRMPFENSSRVYELERNNLNNQSSPLLVSSKGRYVWSDKPYSFSFSDNKLIINSPYETVKVYEGGSTLREAFKSASQRFFPPSGKIPEEQFLSLPQYNTWIELMYNQNQNDILDYAACVKANGFPSGVFMIDDNWQRYYGNYDFKSERFPSPRAMCDSLHKDGFKVMVWICPYVSADTPEYRELERKGLLVKAKGSNRPAMIRWWNGYSAFYDMTNPATMEYLVATLRESMQKYGIDGFKFDGADVAYMDKGAYSFYDKNATNADYTMKWAELGLHFPYNEYRATWKMGGKELVQRLGDKDYSWGAVQALIPDMIAAGLLGHPYTCPDMIGGGQNSAFYNIKVGEFNQELIVRSAQVHALMPMMQFSVAPWRILDKEHLDACRKAARLHESMGGYILQCAREASKSGEPIIRSMEYMFPGNGYEQVIDQFMLGEKYLVAPIVKAGGKRSVILPAGKWRDDLGQTFTGPATIEVSAAIDRLPYFERL